MNDSRDFKLFQWNLLSRFIKLSEISVACSLGFRFLTAICHSSLNSSVVSTTLPNKKVNFLNANLGHFTFYWIKLAIIFNALWNCVYTLNANNWWAISWRDSLCSLDRYRTIIECFRIKEWSLWLNKINRHLNDDLMTSRNLTSTLVKSSLLERIFTPP